MLKSKRLELCTGYKIEGGGLTKAQRKSLERLYKPTGAVKISSVSGDVKAIQIIGDKSLFSKNRNYRALVLREARRALHDRMRSLTA